MNQVSLLTDADLRQTISESLKDFFENNGNFFNVNANPPPSAKNYYTRKEVVKELKITLPTLTKYVKNGVIQSNRIGNRVLFTRENIDNAIIQRKFK